MHRMALFVTKDRMQFKYKVSEYQEKTVKKVTPFTSYLWLDSSSKKSCRRSPGAGRNSMQTSEKCDGIKDISEVPHIFGIPIRTSTAQS